MKFTSITEGYRLSDQIKDLWQSVSTMPNNAVRLSQDLKIVKPIIAFSRGLAKTIGEGLTEIAQRGDEIR